MQVILKEIRLLLKEDLKDYLKQVSEFMKVEFKNYWNLKEDTPSSSIKLPLIHIKDPILKNIKGIDNFDYLSIIEEVQGEEYKRIRKIVK